MEAIITSLDRALSLLATARAAGVDGASVFDMLSVTLTEIRAKCRTLIGEPEARVPTAMRTEPTKESDALKQAGPTDPDTRTILTSSTSTSGVDAPPSEQRLPPPAAYMSMEPQLTTFLARLESTSAIFIDELALWKSQDGTGGSPLHVAVALDDTARLSMILAHAISSKKLMEASKPETAECDAEVVSQADGIEDGQDLSDSASCTRRPRLLHEDLEHRGSRPSLNGPSDPFSVLGSKDSSPFYATALGDLVLATDDIGRNSVHLASEVCGMLFSSSQGSSFF